MITFLFDSATILRQQFEGLLEDAAVDWPLARLQDRLNAAKEESKEQQPRTDSDKASIQPVNEKLPQAYDLVAQHDRELREIKLAIQDLRDSLAQTRLDLAEACNRAEEADRAARDATETSTRLRRRGLLARLLNRD